MNSYQPEFEVAYFVGERHKRSGGVQLKKKQQNEIKETGFNSRGDPERL